MNWAHLHLLVNHVPVIGTVIAVLLLALAVLGRSSELTRVSFGMLVVLALTAGAVYLTGEPAEEVVEDLPGVSEAVIEPHEEAAMVASLLLGAVGAIALGGLILARRGRELPARFAHVVLALAVLAAAAMGRTAFLGGHIRHTEIRAGAPVVDEGP